MPQLYYKVTDFDGIDKFFNSKRKATIYLKKIIKEADDLGYTEPMITFHQFELPKIPKKELVLRLLGDYQFMANVIEFDVNKYK